MTTTHKQLLPFAAILLLLPGLLFRAASAAEPVLAFETEEQSAMYLKLTKEFRCLKCQNQNLADSKAGLADDMRQQIYDRVIAGESEQDIAGYLVARYGDFVLYRPPFKRTTWALWIGPFVLLLVALAYAWRLTRRSNSKAVQPQQEQIDRARNLLGE